MVSQWALGPAGGSVAIGVLSTAVAAALALGAFPLLGARAVPRPEAGRFDDGRHYAAVLRRLSDEVARLASAEAIASYVLAWLRQTLTLRWAAIVLPGEEQGGLFRGGDCPSDLDPPALAAAGAGAPDRARVVPLVAAGARIGALVLGPERHGAEPSVHERALVDLAASVAAVALRNASLLRRASALATALDERERDLAALATRLTGAQEEERRRLSLELHDEPLQRAILLYRGISAAPEHPQSQRWLADVEEIVTSLRATCNGLRPRVLDDFGLVAGLEWLVNDARARSDVDIGLTTAIADAASADRRLPADLELALYRVAQEALNNCLKHADARRVSVTLWWGGGPIRLTIADDGKGFEAAWRGAGGGTHLGILGMRERLRPWNGTVTVGTGPKGGTVVVAELTLEGSGGATE
jgi:signal transduction histidine kinase